MDTATDNQTNEIAQTIRQQIGAGVLMSLGARSFRHGAIAATPEATPLPSLIFDATILPMTKTGDRASAPRTMTVVVSLNAADLYDVRVIYNQRGDQFGQQGPVVHYETTDVDFTTLPRLLLALDYDGDTVTNPRYF